MRMEITEVLRKKVSTLKCFGFRVTDKTGSLEGGGTLGAYAPTLSFVILQVPKVLALKDSIKVICNENYFFFILTNMINMY